MQTTGFVVAATGLAAEARVAARSGGVVAVAGSGDESRLVSLIERSIHEGTRGIISFGICGGLRPDLKPGTCVVGTSVAFSGRTNPSNAAWTQHIAARLPGAELGSVAGTRAVVAEPRAKRELFESTGAIAADMESHVVARLANERHIPFAVLRAIADPAGQRVPPAAVHGLKPDGGPDILAVLKSLGSESGQLWDLMRVAADARRAMTALFRCHRLLGPGLGFADLG